MRRGVTTRLAVGLLGLGLVAGCNGEPSYQGVSFITYNYTPWDLEYVQVQDAQGGKAGTGSVSPGGGEGAVACCYTLQGTEFKVRWRGGDGALMQKYMYDEAKYDSVFFTKTTSVEFPPTKVPPGEGPLYLELHIYPDEHMEMALSRELLGQVRIPIVETTRWLYETHGASLGQFKNVYDLQRALAKVAGQAWKKYKIEDAQDMRQYMLMAFTVASNFDSDPRITEILNKPGRAPGDFATAITALPQATIDQIKAAGSPSGDTNA